MYLNIYRNLAGGSARMAVSTISARAHSFEKRFSGVWLDTPVFLNRFCRNLAGGSARMGVFKQVLPQPGRRVCEDGCEHDIRVGPRRQEGLREWRCIPTASPARVCLQLHIFPQPLLPECVCSVFDMKLQASCST